MKISQKYLCIGHSTRDMEGKSEKIGGTAVFSTLTAKALEYEPIIITAGSPPGLSAALSEIKVYQVSRDPTTTFVNREEKSGRTQCISEVAKKIQIADIPSSLFNFSGMLHIGPVADEVDSRIIDLFPNAFIGATPQGWMRQWNGDGLVSLKKWNPENQHASRINVVVFSIDDIGGNRDAILAYSRKFNVLAVTEGAKGAKIYWKGEISHIQAPEVNVTDPTGAGDIFAAVFFIRLHQGYDPVVAGRQAVKLASFSVTRKRLESIPTKKEIQTTMVEII